MSLLDKAKGYAEKAADKAKQATAAGKDKYDDVRLTKKINELYTEIGKLVVAERRGGPAADAEITAKVDEIAELEQEIVENNAAGAEGDNTDDAAADGETEPSA